MSIDLPSLRADTPGVAHVLHLNNAGAALPPRQVTETQIAHLRLEAEIGGYEAAAARDDAFEAVYDSIAALIGARRQEIALVENATVAWNGAFSALSFRPGDRILTAEAEYESNYIVYLQAAKRQGVTVEVVPSDAAGALSLDALEALLAEDRDKRIKLIAVSHVPTNGGLVNPAAGIGRLARAAGVPFLLDACQSVGQLVIDVEEIGCDFLSATGRKYLRGPRGTGFLYVRGSRLGALEPEWVDMRGGEWLARDRYRLRGDARRFENWEFNVAGVLGLGAAVDYALAIGTPALEERIKGLAAMLRAELDALPGVTVRDLGQEKCGLVTFTIEGMAAEDIKAALGAQAINVSVSSRSSTLLDFERRGLPALVRASPHAYNSEEELSRFSAAVAALKA